MLKKLFITLLFIFLGIYAYSQETKDSVTIAKDSLSPKTNKKWKIIGDNNFSLTQNSFSNWIAGGNNSLGGTVKLKYEFLYKKNKNLWKNKIELGYGQINSEGEKMRKTEDLILLSSNYGYQLNKNWYASIAAIIQTQIANGYDYNAYPDYTSTHRKTSFMSPGYLTIGLGVEYKPEGNFQIILMPLTSKTTFVLDEKLQKKGNFGLKHDEDWMLMELGAYVTFKYKKEIMKNIMWENNLVLFSNYLNHSERVDIAYKMLVNMKVNSYVSAKLSVDILYDHDQIRKTQLKQILGVGFAYKFKNYP